MDYIDLLSKLISTDRKHIISKLSIQMPVIVEYILNSKFSIVGMVYW